MRKLVILVSVLIVLIMLMGSAFIPAYAQAPSKDNTPTFYRWTPGTYVNGWPRFTITYPKDWVERPLPGGVFFWAKSPGPARMESVAIAGGPIPVPLDKYVDFAVPYFKRQASDVTVVSDKPSRLRNGTPARELEMKFVMNGQPVRWLGVATKRDDILVSANVSTSKGIIGEDLRAIAYSIEFEPDKDKPVKVPPDVQEFLDKHRDDSISHDITKVVSHFSDKYLNSGVTKGKLEQALRPLLDSITSLEIAISDFIPAGDKAYLTGFMNSNLGKLPIAETAIIKENGEWKWYGNQRNPAP
jgi:hypothetical protein